MKGGPFFSGVINRAPKWLLPTGFGGRNLAQFELRADVRYRGFRGLLCDTVVSFAEHHGLQMHKTNARR